MRRALSKFNWLPLALLLAGCGAGNSESGGAGGSTTPFIGDWFLVATLNVNVGGTPTFLTDTSQIVVGAGGNAVIAATDSQCTLNIFVNGDVMTYETTCVFTAASGDITAPCSLTMRAQARIRGPQGGARASGSFGPETVACSGAAVSFAGNLVASQGTGPDMDDGADEGDGDGTGEET